MRVISLRVMFWGGFFEVVVSERNVLGYCFGVSSVLVLLQNEFNAGVVVE